MSDFNCDAIPAIYYLICMCNVYTKQGYVDNFPLESIANAKFFLFFFALQEMKGIHMHKKMINEKEL
jgi:hypothetical protein